MAKQTINVGITANDRRGDPLRTAFTKINQNFDEVYNIIPTQLSDLTNDEGFIAAGSIASDLIPEDDSTYDLGSPTKQWKSLYVSANTIFIGGTPLSVDGEGNLTVSGSPIVGTGSAILPYLEVTNRAFNVLDPVLGDEVSFTKENGDSGNTAIDFIDTGVALTRENQGGLFNIASEESWNSDRSPEGTLWNSDGWSNINNYKTRDYISFYEALDQEIGNRILDSELIMWDTINDKYYTFDFSSWTQGGNGGGFSYVRREIIDPNLFVKTPGGSEVDVISEGLHITRGNNGWLFNPLEDGGHNDDTPTNSLWNNDGWDDLSNIEERNYVSLSSIWRYNFSDIVGAKMIMLDTTTNKYYAIEFLDWGQNNGGSFAYNRYEINLDQLQEGIVFADGSVQKSAYIETNVLSTAQFGRRIEERDGFARVQLTELIFGETIESTLYTAASNTRFLQVSATQEFTNLYNTGNGDIQISFDETEWIDARITGFSTVPVLRYFVETVRNEDTITADQGDTIYIRSRAGAEPVRWFRADGNYFRGAILDFHAYSSRSGTIVGTIHIIRDGGDYNITHTEVKSGDISSLESLNIWLRQNNEREIWVRRSDGQSDTIAFHWHGKFFYGREYWD